MVCMGHNTEHERYRVALFVPSSRKVLTERDGNVLRLPSVEIPKKTRTAEQIAHAIRQRWNTNSIVLDFLPNQDNLPRCAVVEVRSPLAVGGLFASNIEDLRKDMLTAKDRTRLRNLMACHVQEYGPFSRPGWIDEAREWIRASVTDHRVEFDDDGYHSCGSGFSALVRFGTLRGPAYWLKATSTPNAHEFLVTRTLAQFLPHYLPPMVAAREDWNAWVMEEAGLPLHEACSFHAFEQATCCLAELQIASAAHVDVLIASGCFDQRMSVLRTRLPEMIEYLKDAMARQTSTKVPPLSAERLHELGSLLEDACARMDQLGIPDTIIHNDMNPGNILFDGTRAVFTDWAEGYIGTPFFTFHHLRVQALEADPTHTWALQLTAIYKDHWRKVLSETQIERATALCPPLAIASYLCGRGSHLLASEAGVQSYARSLARHMDRAARTSEFLEALCN